MKIMNGHLINGNSDEVLVDLIEQGKKFDLILTDPPYNLNKDFGNASDSLSLEEFVKVSKRRIELCRDLLTPEGSLVWFGIHNYIGYLQVLMYEAGLHYRRMNIWRYENGFSRSKRVPAGEFEPFLWFSRSSKKWTYNVDDLRVPYKSAGRLKSPVYYRGANGEKKVWSPNPLGAMRGDIWEYPALAGQRFAKERTKHPTQKPEALFVELLTAFCPKNNDGHFQATVLDPFLGSGTTAVAAEKLNSAGHCIEWTGIELEKKWCETSQKRLVELNKETLF